MNEIKIKEMCEQLQDYKLKEINTIPTEPYPIHAIILESKMTREKEVLEPYQLHIYRVGFEFEFPKESYHFVGIFKEDMKIIEQLQEYLDSIIYDML